MRKEQMRMLPIGARVVLKAKNLKLEKDKVGKVGVITKKATDDSAAYVKFMGVENLPFYCTGGSVSWSAEGWYGNEALKKYIEPEPKKKDPLAGTSLGLCLDVLAGKPGAAAEQLRQFHESQRKAGEEIATSEASVKLKTVNGKWRAIGYKLHDPCPCGGSLDAAIIPVESDADNMKLMLEGMANVKCICDKCNRSIVVERIKIPKGQIDKQTLSMPWIYLKDNEG